MKKSIIIAFFIFIFCCVKYGYGGRGERKEINIQEMDEKSIEREVQIKYNGR